MLDIIELRTIIIEGKEKKRKRERKEDTEEHCLAGPSGPGDALRLDTGEHGPNPVIRFRNSKYKK